MLKVYRNHDRKDGLVGSWRFDSRIGEAESGVYKNPLAWQPSVRSLNGSHTASGVTVDLQKEYYEMILNVTASNGYWCGEFQVPDSYMGLDVFAYESGNWVLKNGSSGYTVSVPYVYDYTDKLTGSAYSTGSSIPKDWGSDDLVKGSSVSGSKYRVQLRVSSNLQLKIQICYTDRNGFGFDGVNDRYVCGMCRYSPSEDFTLYGFTRPRFGVGNYSLHIFRADWLDVYGGYDLRFVVPSEVYPNLEIYDRSITNFNFYTHCVSYKYKEVQTAFIRDGSAKKCYMFVDYSIVGSCDDYTSDTVGGADMTLGSGSGGFEYFRGEMYLVGIWSKKLSVDELIKLKEGVIPSNARMWYDGMYLSGLVDRSGNGYNAVAYGNAQYKIWQGDGFKVTVV